MKRPFQLVADIQDKDAEIARLKASNTLLQGECAKRGMKIADLERLLTRAADALQAYKWGFPDGNQIRQLVDELRKAAE